LSRRTEIEDDEAKGSRACQQLSGARDAEGVRDTDHD
jgi:hypothetical protein